MKNSSRKLSGDQFVPEIFRKFGILGININVIAHDSPNIYSGDLGFKT
jgi:hypothetical protein